MNDQSPLVQLANICKHYRSGEEQVKALDNVSLNIDKGEYLVYSWSIRFRKINPDECSRLFRYTNQR
ncbi:hypothetical protein ACT691_05100 [Vibrio metschnikovii]